MALSRTGQNFVPPKLKDFCCPICNSNDYKQITRSNGILGPGGRVYLDHCECLGCSATFKDAEKFTKAKEQN
jgi:hypothetical protein